MKFCKFFFNTKNTNPVKEKICQSCKIKKLENKFVCGVCKTIRDIRPSQYLNRMNFFSVFNLDSGYKIDKNTLDHQYKELQKLIHPDKYALSDELKLKGYEGIEENSNCINEKEFLEYLMDIQESIDEAESKEEVEKIKDDILNKIHELKRELEIAFENENLHRVKEELKSLKFHLTILQNIENKLYINRH